MSKAITVSSSCTLGWTDCVHGDLWLLEEGLLRIASDVAATFRGGVGPAILWHGPRVASITL